MELRADGAVLRDEHGRQRILHGINLVDKGAPGATDPAAFRGRWTAEDLDQLVGIGLDSVRLGLSWAATEPRPGEYSAEHLGWIEEQLDRCHRAGMSVVLDAHQDLFSQRWGNGAPEWATLTEEPFEDTELWSDAYLSSPAVHEAYDAFWADAPGPDGVGIQTRLAAMWAAVAERFAGHPALIGYDLLNEPTPGAGAATAFEAVIGAFAQETGQDPRAVALDFTDPGAKLAQLAHLEDPAVHRRVGDAVAPLLAGFEQEAVHGLFTRAVPGIRAHDPHGLILREHSYFSNIGIPAAIPPLEDRAWAYSPHGYDLVVDTEAMPLASDRRVETIFTRAAETADHLGVTVIAGEWGAFGDHIGIARHATHQLDLFDRFGWSWFYWCWTETFARSEAAGCLRRPRPVAVAGRDLRWGAAPGGWHAAWQGEPGGGHSEFWVPAERPVRLLRDEQVQEVDRDGGRVRVAAGAGHHELLVS